MSLSKFISKRWLFVLVFFSIIAVARWWYMQRIMPAVANQDEMALLMNARFLAESGQDEWGSRFPVVLKSFGDAKLIGYPALVAGLGKFMGFTSWWTVRLPSFVAGLVMIWLLYQLGKTLSNRLSAALAVLLLVLSPWPLHYSSIGFEAHVGLALFVGSLLLFLRARSWKHDLAAAVLLLLAGLTYNAPFLLSPLLVIAIIFSRWGKTRAMMRGLSFVVVFAGIAGALTLPATLQKQGVSLLSNPTLIDAYPAYREQFAAGWQKTLLGNNKVYYGLQIARNFISQWSWSFLVERGGANPWHTIPGHGHVHWLVAVAGIGEALWLFIRIVRAAVRKRWPLFRTKVLLLLLLIGSTAPAIITVDAPHATRSLFFFVMLTLIAGIGLSELWRFFMRRVSFRLTPILGLGAFLLIGMIGWFGWNDLHAAWEAQLSERWEKNLPQLLQDERVRQANQVTITDSNGTLYPYAVWADNLSAATFLETVDRSGPDIVGLYKVHKVGKFQFMTPEEALKQSGVVLYKADDRVWEIRTL